ncbi:MAG TPA: hypothetical protein PLD59_11805 [Tepidisphaeraceae bacterium]|nr:hypothetical protein [Tepidisphaeraceae bacterium]
MPFPSAIFSLIAVGALWLAVGNSLGLWLGGFGVVALLLPPLCLHGPTLLKRLIDAAIVTDCIVVVWLLSAAGASVTLLDWFLCTAVLYAFAAAGFGMAHALRALRLPADLAAAGAILVLTGWLAAPVWLSPVMNDSLADVISSYHPLIAINSRLAELGIWLEQPIIYRHTVLGQDVAYSLPSSLWPVILLHAAVGGCAASIAIFTGFWRARTID